MGIIVHAVWPGFLASVSKTTLGQVKKIADTLCSEIAVGLIMNKTNCDKNTQERIEEAFWILASKKEIQKITTSNIAQLAYIHRNTFYRYYPSIYSLLDSMELKLVDTLVPYADMQMSDQEEFVKEIFSNILKTNNEKFQIIIKRDAPGFAEKYKMKLFPILKKNFNIKDKPQMNDYMIDYILSGSIALIVRYFQTPSKQTTEFLADTIISYFNKVYNDTTY